MNRRKAGWRIAVAVLALLAVGAAVISVWQARTPGAEVNLADVVAVALAGAMLVGTVVVWALRSARAAASASADAGASVDVDAAAQRLADLVKEQWHTEARHRLLEDEPGPIPVHWQLIVDDRVMSQPHLITTEAELTFTGSSNHIAALAEAFRGLKRRRLVIAGGAGMGKTTLAMQLLLQLLSTRTADQSGAREGEVVPVPVLLPISGWDTNAHPLLQDWLAIRLTQDYPALAAPELGGGTATELAKGGHILAVLDGLDEIPAATRAQVIAALNASLTVRDQLILTSRRSEFTTAIHETGRPLTAAAVIVPKPVTPQASANYLSACLPASPCDAWVQVLAALRSGTVPGLTRLAATPLGLWLIRTIYLTPGADPAPLTGPLGGDADALRAHLLNRLIPNLIDSRPPSTDPADHFRPRHRLDPDTTRRHLTYLARAFPPTATRDIAWWHIARTTPHIRLTVGLVAGLLAGLEFVVGLRLVFEFVVGFGLVFGLAAATFWVNETPGYANVCLRGRTLLLRRSIKDNLKQGFIPMTAVGVLAVRSLGLVPGLVVGLSAGLGFTLAFGLINWAEQPTLISTSTPRSSWQADRALTLLRMAMLGLTTVFMPVFGTVAVFGAWLGFAVVFGLLLGKHHAWLTCTIAVARLALEHRLPWRIMDFLDDAHRLGLLRAVGPVYQFRHAVLHDHLAADTSDGAS
ncbi:NACHT domain-containing protein [Streptosporangium sp. NBC_01495]|uniref:NACHT domain-containing protein n=1 Tax=Streptosporangium sp. NBC_01495 TaxID=2903899 RepID=UPI002E35D90B|nr:NACHT domain-containing protein [Streptosporangium sp. NBC_01495]